MATATAAEPTPAPGPELTLGGASRINTLSKEAQAKLEAAFGSASGASAPATPTPAPAAPAPEPPKPKAASTAPAPAKPEPAKAAAPEPTPAPAAAAKSEPPTAKPDKGAPAQLREALERAQARVTELENTYNATSKEKAEAFAKLADVEQKVRAYEERIAKEFEPLKAQYEAQGKRLQEREEALRMRDYTATTEWHERYVKPIIDLQQEAAQFVSELVATVDGKEVQATPEHLGYVLSAPNANEAARRAEQLFGSNTALTGPLVNYRTRIRAAQTKQQETLKTAQLESAEWQKRNQQQQAEAVSTFKARVAERVQRYLTKPADTEPEALAAYAEGEKLVALIRDGDPRLSADDVADTVARAHARIVDAPVKAVLLGKAEARIKELEAELAQYRVSEPPVETRRGGEPPAAPADTRRVPGGLSASTTADLLAKAQAAARR